MKIYLSKNNDVFKNIALDEALLFHDKVEEDTLFIYQNKKTIVVGRNQNIYKIINHDFIEKKGITITRRLSGGGAIYQDMGTVSFSFIATNSKRLLSEILKPITNFLNNIGLPTKVKNGKNIYAGDRKISIITQYHYKDKILYRGVLLFNSDLKMLINTLTRNDHIGETRLTDHANNDVSNIKDLLKTNWTSKTFTIQLINYFQKLGNTLCKPSTDIEKEATKIWLRTSSWEWVYGPWPSFKTDNTQQFPGGILEIKYDHENGKIKNIKIFGDFNSRKNTSEIEKALQDINIKKNPLLKALSPFKSSLYFGQISKKDIVNTILGVSKE